MFECIDSTSKLFNGQYFSWLRSYGSIEASMLSSCPGHHDQVMSLFHSRVKLKNKSWLGFQTWPKICISKKSKTSADFILITSPSYCLMAYRKYGCKHCVPNMPTTWNGSFAFFLLFTFLDFFCHLITLVVDCRGVVMEALVIRVHHYSLSSALHTHVEILLPVYSLIL